MKLDGNFSERRFLGQDVFEYLKQAIIDETIEPGSRLVETKIAKMLGISRTPLREALHKLEREEWIEKIPSGGFQVVVLTRDDIEQTFGIRSVLEAYAARLAAENFTKKDLVPLEKKMKEFQKLVEKQEKNWDKKDYDKLQNINTQFHDLLYGLSQNPKLIKMINQLRAHISRFRKMILTQEGSATESFEDHAKMLIAIKKGDGEAVEKLVRVHILKGKDVVLNQFKAEGKHPKSA